MEMLEEMDPARHENENKSVMENRRKFLWVVIKKAMCGVLQSSSLFCEKLRKNSAQEGFTMNPCNPCTATKDVAGKQMTMVQHVDDLKVSHIDSGVVDQFVEWVEKTQRPQDRQGEVKEGKTA